MNAPDIHVSVVVPVFHSTALCDLTARLMAVLGQAGCQYEIVFVDDGSPDGSWEVLADLQAAHPDRVSVIRLMRNFGQHNALMCGLRHARGRYVITMDDDLQHPPEEIPKLLAAIEKNQTDLVYGVPRRKEHQAWRNFGSRLVTAFYRLVFRTKVQPTAFRIMRRELVDAILSYNLNYTYIDGLLAWNTQRIAEVEVEHRPRTSGRSGYSLSKLVVLALNLFTNFSLLPLQAVSATGFVASLGGLALGAYYLARHLFGEVAVPGYASTIVAVLVLGGLQLLALGVMGEYLGRVHLNINRKPQYTIREIRSALAPNETQPPVSGPNARCSPRTVRD